MTSKSLFALFTIAFFVQSAHHSEHVAQIIQIYVQQLTISQANGLLGSQFNFEWVHFTYNTLLEIAIIVIAWSYYRCNQQWRLSSVERTIPLLKLLDLSQAIMH